MQVIADANQQKAQCNLLQREREIERARERERERWQATTHCIAYNSNVHKAGIFELLPVVNMVLFIFGQLHCIWIRLYNILKFCACQRPRNNENLYKLNGTEPT